MKELVETMAEIIVENVDSGKVVPVPGIGRISLRNRPRRLVRNPKTGERSMKDADRVPKMAFSKSLKKRVET